jgi:hypothetical protein
MPRTLQGPEALGVGPQTLERPWGSAAQGFIGGPYAY